MRHRWCGAGATLVGVGVAAGAVAALAVPEHETRSATALAAPILRERPAQVVPARTAAVQPRVVGAVIVAARVRDPAGGPDWAVWRFNARRPSFTEGRALDRFDPVRCAQLVRLVGDRAGWLDGEGTFRPVRPGSAATPSNCLTRREDRDGAGFAEAIHPLRGLGGPSPQISTTIVWGGAGATARNVRVRLAGRLRAVPQAREGTILMSVDRRFYGAHVPVVAEYPGRGTVDSQRRQEQAEERMNREAPRWLRRRLGETRAAAPRQDATVRIGARAADPSGGLPFGVPIARGPRGWCAGQPGRIVEDHVGYVDRRTGLLRDLAVGTMNCSHPTPGRESLLGVRGGGDLGQEPPDRADAGSDRVARRALPDVTYVAGMVSPQLRTLTLRSPRDVRTVVPQGPAHVYLVVYDGRFTTGTLRYEGRYADGRIQRQSTRLSGF